MPAPTSGAQSRPRKHEDEEHEMYESQTFLDYEIAYRRERLMEAGTGHRARPGRRPWTTRPARRPQR